MPQTRVSYTFLQHARVIREDYCDGIEMKPRYEFPNTLYTTFD